MSDSFPDIPLVRLPAGSTITDIDNSGLLPVIECQTEDGALYRVEYGFEGSKIVTRFHKQPPVDITKIGR